MRRARSPSTASIPATSGGKRHDDNFRAIIEVAIDNGKPVRIGVNWGSLDQNLLTEMMDANAKQRRAARRARRDHERHGRERDPVGRAGRADRPRRTIASSSRAKVSGVQDLVDVYRKLAPRSDYPLHLGLTEAGMGAKGIVASTAGLSILLQEGIGDTIRVSLTPKPGGDRTEEVQVAQQVLQSLGLRSFMPAGHRLPRLRPHHPHLLPGDGASRSRPTCASRCRCGSRRIPGVEELNVAVMGCVVNGPGEIQARQHRHLAARHLRGAQGARLRGRRAQAHAQGRHASSPSSSKILDSYVEKRYAAAKK